MDFSWIEDTDQRAKAEEDYKKSIQEALDKEVQGLKNKNTELLEEKRAAAEKLEEIKMKTEGLDLDKAKEIMEKFKESERENLIKNGKVEELVQAAVQNRERELEGKYQSQLETITAEKEAVSSSAQKYEKLYKNKIIEDALRTVAMQSGCHVQESVIQDIIMRGKKVFSLNSEENNIIAMKSDGSLQKTKDGKILAPEVWAEELKEQCPHYFPASSGTGASGSGSSAGTNSSDALQRRAQKALAEGNMAEYNKIRKEQGM